MEAISTKKLRGLLTKKPFTRILPGDSKYEHGYVWNEPSEMHIPKDALRRKIVTQEDFLRELFSSIDHDPKTEVEVDLPRQTVTNLATGRSEQFEINGYKKHCLVNGLDDIDFLLQSTNKIEEWEQQNN